MSDTRPTQPIRILLVEDNPADVRLTTEALKEARIANRMTVAEDGVEAMEILLRRGRHADAERPELILLDLNLPKKNGWEVLSEIKSDPTLRRIPVVILTTSKAERDLMAAYDLHANSYIVKPVDLAQFLHVMSSIADFWFTVVTLPPR